MRYLISMKMIKAFKEASAQTKIFWMASLSVGLITVALCLYPYVWLDHNRSVKERENQ